ncbi:PREDICTED: uncharacterized protein LOC108377572 isoform X2 [Rhagoletis zephyria]|uniref:uncharacterized protein LOC108377572 isoform X2 n=1 Tax=Rhagoletis zephyria TaxID=28612 RepID=UPI0008118DF2|nr:PREDICTED: uncharacterized protein LOC108377572 isoform X2 [Rhagoletis zephyria]
MAGAVHSELLCSSAAFAYLQARIVCVSVHISWCRDFYYCILWFSQVQPLHIYKPGSFVCPSTLAGTEIFTTASFGLVNCSLCIFTSQDHLNVRPHSLLQEFLPLQPLGWSSAPFAYLKNQM